MILVTAANGNQGKVLVPRLLAAGHRVRASVRSAASADAMRAAGVTEVVVGNLAEPDVLSRAVRGARRSITSARLCRRTNARSGSPSSMPPGAKVYVTSS